MLLLNNSARFQGNWELKIMPVYEFECECGHRFENLVRMGTAKEECPVCRKAAKKIMSACTFELKGGGWYADGYASKKK
jgi:putative FmdB family regulatory protein